MTAMHVNKCVSDAITRSVSHTDVATVEGLEELLEAVKAELERECDGSVVLDGIVEYWGTTLAGDDWRVHVRTV